MVKLGFNLSKLGNFSCGIEKNQVIDLLIVINKMRNLVKLLIF